MADSMNTSSMPSASTMPSTTTSSNNKHDGTEEPQSAQDLTVFVQNLLQQMQGRFQSMSTAIIGRIDEMGTRIDGLEKSIAELMTQAGIEEEEGKHQQIQ